MTFRQLTTAAHVGLVVILNIDNLRCDALVLITDDSEDKHVSVIHMPLISPMKMAKSSV